MSVRPSTGYVFSNVRVFDGSGAPPFAAEVVVEGSRIVAVSAAPERVTRAPGLAVVDGAGATLMPGLVEAHAHLSWPSSVEQFYPQLVLPPAEMQVATTRNARIFLDHGFTSAYSAGALDDRIEVRLRDEIVLGRLPGPRLRASTIERAPDGAEQAQTDNVARGRGPQALRAFIAHCQSLGADCAKLQISGEDALVPGDSQRVLYTAEEVAAACDEAAIRGLWVNAHTQAAEAIKIGVRGGVRALYHCSYADEEALDLLQAHRDRLFVAPAIGVIVATLEATPPPHIDMSAMKEAAKPVIENASRLIPELKRRGVRVLPGGDYGFPFNPIGRNARDLEHFVRLFGYTPAEALHAATQLGGELMGRGHELGLVKPGYLADLLLVDGDPCQDVRVLQDRSRLRMVMQDGRLHRAPPGLVV